MLATEILDRHGPSARRSREADREALQQMRRTVGCSSLSPPYRSSTRQSLLIQVKWNPWEELGRRPVQASASPTAASRTQRRIERSVRSAPECPAGTCIPAAPLAQDFERSAQGSILQRFAIHRDIHANPCEIPGSATKHRPSGMQNPFVLLEPTEGELKTATSSRIVRPFLSLSRICGSNHPENCEEVSESRFKNIHRSASTSPKRSSRSSTRWERGRSPCGARDSSPPQRHSARSERTAARIRCTSTESRRMLLRYADRFLRGSDRAAPPRSGNRTTIRTGTCASGCRRQKGRQSTPSRR